MAQNNTTIFRLLQETFLVGIEEFSKSIGHLFHTEAGGNISNNQITRELEQREVTLKKERI